MEFRQLQILVTIADQGSFIAAADALSTSQSNVSAHIARLESRLEVELIDRKSSRLTPEGEMLARNARSILTTYDMAISEVCHFRDIDLHEISIGLACSLPGGFATPSIEPIAGQPQAMTPRLRLQYRSSEEIEDEVVSAKTHIGLVILPAHHETLDRQLVGFDPLVALVNANERAAHRKFIHVDELRDFDFHLPNSFSRERLALEASLLNAGVQTGDTAGHEHTAPFAEALLDDSPRARRTLLISSVHSLNNLAPAAQPPNVKRVVIPLKGVLGIPIGIITQSARPTSLQFSRVLTLVQATCERELSSPHTPPTDNHHIDTRPKKLRSSRKNH